MKRIKPGDIAVFPIEDNVFYDEQGNYMPHNKDKVCFVQFITNETEGKFDYLAVFEGVFTYNEISKISLEDISSSKVLFLFASKKSFMGNGAWKFLGNASINSKMPMQSFYIEYIDSETKKTIYEIQDYKYSNDDPKQGHKKKSNYFTATRLHKNGISVTSNYIPLVCKVYYKIDSYKKYSIDIKRYMPKKSGVVWKIFPEFYKNSWKE